MLAERGEAWLRQFFAQDLVISSDYRQVLDWVVRGQYPVGIGIIASNLKDYQKEGAGLNVKLLPADPKSTWLNMGYGVALGNRAPHPNAAKVFVNWALTKGAQTSYAKNLQNNSRRLDVEPGDPTTKPDPTIKNYHSTNGEDFQPYLDRVVAIAKELIK